MDSIKPVDGISKENEGQALVLAEVARERYWKNQRVQTLQTLEASDQTQDTPEKRREANAEKNQNQSHHTYAEFQINRETREIIVRIVDAESGKLIRTIPPDELAKEIIKGNFQPKQLRHRAVFV